MPSGYTNEDDAADSGSDAADSVSEGGNSDSEGGDNDSDGTADAGAGSAGNATASASPGPGSSAPVGGAGGKGKRKQPPLQQDGSAEPAKKTKKKGSKKVKDPHAPKAPATAYVLFCTDARAQLKREQPDMPPTAIMKVLGAQWKAADEEVRKPYIAAYAKEKLKYVEAKEAYLQNAAGAPNALPPSHGKKRKVHA